METAAAAASDKANWRIYATLALPMLLASQGTSIANVALPALAEAFSAPFTRVQGVVVAYLAALTASTLVVGRLGDTYGLRRMYLLGLWMFGVASLLCGLAPSLGWLVVARVLQGLGAAFLMTLALALMRETATREHLGRAMGLLGTMSALGTALGPTLGGLLIPATGWRGIFLVQIPLTVVALMLARASLPRHPGRTSRRPEGLRAAFDRSLLPNLAINFLVAAVMMTTLVVGPFYLSLGAGLTATVVGLAMSIGPTIAILSGLPAGRAVDGWGARRVLGCGLALVAIGALLLAILPAAIGVAGYVLAIAVLTPGYQLFQAANNTAALAEVPEHRRGTTSGLLNLARNVGLIVGASFMGGVFAAAVGTGDLVHALPSAIVGGMRATFMLAAGMMLVAILVAFGPSAACDLRRAGRTLLARVSPGST